MKDEEVEERVTKNQMKKIKTDGHFQGRNKIYFDREGKSFTQIDKKKMEYAANESAATQNNLADQYGLKVVINKELDTQVQKDRVKEKKLKKKLKKKQEYNLLYNV